METVSGFIGGIAIILLILTVVSLLLLIVVRGKHEEDEAFDGINESIGQLRKSRYEILKSLTSAFSEVPGADYIDRLLGEYPYIENDEAESTWEQEFLPAMKTYMESINSSVSSDSRAYVKEIVDEFTNNELSLQSERERYREAKAYMERYDKPPLSFIVVLANFFMKATAGGVDKYNQARDKYGVLRENYEQHRRKQEELMNFGRRGGDE